MNTTINVAGYGEVNFLGKSRLDTISISSFFPAQNYSFCQYNTFPQPYECVALIKKFKEKGQVRLLVTGTDINKIFYIEEFNYSEKDGTGDVYFSIAFKEYRKITIEKQTITQTGGKSTTTTSIKAAVRPVTKAIEKTYTVKAGDTLYLIAKRQYGNGNKWRDIYNKNKDKIKNPNLIHPGQVLRI